MKNIAILSIVLLAFSCTQKEQKSVPKTNLKLGKQLTEAKCISCHSSKTSMESSIAPPLAMIKDVYQLKYATNKSFTENMSSWLFKPNQETALLKKSVKTYGLMPNLNISKSELEHISNYIYTSDLEKPKWYNIGDGEKKIGKNKFSEWMDVVVATKKELGKNLMGQINKHGTEKALEFCNINAIPITKSKSEEFNKSIKRVSDKPRNSNNLANSKELNIIKAYKTALKNGLELKPVLKEGTFYAPITTNKMCMQCHGVKEEQIKPSVLEQINKRYPKDLATGYKPNALRGIWVIE